MTYSSPRRDAALARLKAKTSRSAAMRPHAEQLLALEAVPTFSLPTPIYIDRALGATMTDLDGNDYIDLAMGFGSNILGHRPPEVEAALIAQVGKCWHTVIPSTPQYDLAELLVDAVPCAEKVVFTNSGTEATMYGMRLARAYTKKEKVAVFGGGYHGTHDYALIQEDPKSQRDAPTAKTIGLGVPASVRDETMIVLPYRDPAAFDIIRRNRDALAMVIVQPVQNTTPFIDNHDFLQGLRDVCDECGVLLMFDEVVTGFRLAYGGAQVYYGVTPDLASFGKIIGGGAAVGALCGRDALMGLFAQPGSSGVFSGGTFNGNPISMTAGAATLRLLKERKDEIYPGIERRSARLASTIAEHCASNGMGVTLMHAASIQCIHFVDRPIRTFRDLHPSNRAAEEAFYIFLLDRGVLLPGFHVYFLSAAHDDAMIGRLETAFVEALDECRADGLL
ncbi:MAG TPA: aspartate aminotransferase family protein [Parvularculaceae bacterium]|nr:aspartate aminotransferase family protein [Parvularculaceae bacterium]